jgi:signal transduction histidine kinase
MGSKSFDYLAIAQAISENIDWKPALDSLIRILRVGFVFDNLVIYLMEDDRLAEEVVYAKAMGRGQSAEADVAWGEMIASQVFESGNVVVQNPPEDTHSDSRLSQVYLLGLPLRMPDKIIGALVFVRFGGPVFTSDQIYHAEYVAAQIGYLFERRANLERVSNLEEAQRLLRLQDDFIATISHELRTPLGFIKGYSTTLLRNDTTWDQATQREFLSIIDEEADYLTGLIENMLESARLQSQTLQFNFQPIRLDALLRDVIMRVNARHKDLNVNLKIETSPFIEADAVRLAQVLENLFSNAVKYAPGSKVRIKVVPEDERVHIVFADRGPGIPPEHLPYIFERFYRVPGQQGRSGTGLGLFICKQIITAYRGEIKVKSKLGQGTTFHIYLPIRRKEEV